jgi:HAD superfamily hydrolase (TIGR01549 family)
MAIKAILFDLGGTLLHYHDAGADPARPFQRITLTGFKAVLAAISAEGHAVPTYEAAAERLDAHIREAYLTDRAELRGGSVEMPMQAALHDVGIELGDGRWASLRPHFYRPIDAIVSSREGIVETLRALRDGGYQLGLISNTYWAADLHDRHLAAHDLLDLLPVRVYSSEAAHRKPHPTIFEQALEQMGVAAGEAAYVGDRADVDVAGAQGVGMLGVLIDSPFRSEGLMGVIPDAIIGEIPGLLNVIPLLGARTA